MNSIFEPLVITLGLGLLSLTIPGFIWIGAPLWLLYALHLGCCFVAAVNEVITPRPDQHRPKH